MPVYQRISARRGNIVELNNKFRRGGILADPYAIRKVEIYKTQVLPHNKVAEFLIDSPCGAGSNYPSPVEQITDDIPEGDCGTEAQIGLPVAGCYKLDWEVPADAEVPDIYFDVWSYIPTNPCLLSEFEDSTVCEEGTSDPCYDDLDDEAIAGLVLQCCNKFWVYPDDWQCMDGLQTIRLGFEPLDQKFRQPESRPLEVGITPLPLYDYNYNLNAPVIPNITATIRIETMHKEVLVDNAPMEMGLRQGSYRTNPFVLRYNVDTSTFLIGTYRYRITATLPDGSTRASKDFIFTVA